MDSSTFCFFLFWADEEGGRGERRFDGILGVLGAVEVLRTMKENGFVTDYDIGIVNWTK